VNRPPYRRSDGIAAYTYRADLHCPRCVIEVMIATGIASPAARDMPVEDVLDQCAAAMAIDSDDETSFDTDEFPKPCFVDSLDPADTCGTCHQPL
jgi:hypothetical protein